MPTDPVHIAKLPSAIDVLLDGGAWLWLAAGWLVFVVAFRGARERVPTWPLIVMVWSVGRAFGLYRYGLQAPGHGYYAFSFFAWFELVNTAWQGLLLVVVLSTAALLDRRVVSLRNAGRSGVLGAVAAVAAVLYCWFSLAVATAGPILAEAVRNSADS